MIDPEEPNDPRKEIHMTLVCLYAFAIAITCLYNGYKAHGG